MLELLGPDKKATLIFGCLGLWRGDLGNGLLAELAELFATKIPGALPLCNEVPAIRVPCIGGMSESSCAQKSEELLSSPSFRDLQVMSQNVSSHELACQPAPLCSAKHCKRTFERFCSCVDLGIPVLRNLLTRAL